MGEQMNGRARKAGKKSISEAEALVLLQQVTQETEQRMEGVRKANRKVVTVIIVGVAICVFVAIVMLIMNQSKS